MRSIIAFFVSLLLIGCSTQDASEGLPYAVEVSVPVIRDTSTGAWKNIHRANPDLAGALVQQFPDSSLEAPAWEGKHPAMILFVMWDGRVNQIGYKPSGKIAEDLWWNLNEGDRDYSYIWEQLDFSHGSDPAFEHHHDPRTTNKTSLSTSAPPRVQPAMTIQQSTCSRSLALGQV